MPLAVPPDAMKKLLRRKRDDSNDEGLHGAPFILLVDNGSARRRRDRRLRTSWRHKQMTMNMALATATHHSYHTNGATEKTVGHGPTGADETYLSVRTIVTRGPAGSCAISITAVVAVAIKMIDTRQSTRALTVSSGMPRRTRGGNGASALQVVGPFPSGNVTQAGTIRRRVPILPSQQNR